MHIHRLFGIVHILLNKKQITSRELAQRFEVSKRTILRDLDVLSVAGIPIYTSKGKGGGVAILDGYTLNKTSISDEEQATMLSSLQCLSALNDENNNKSSHLLSKLSNMFGKNQTNWIEVDFANWDDSDNRQVKVSLLKEAIFSHSIMEFSYANLQGEKTVRRVYPLKLLFKSQDWYLHAYCQTRMDYRFFKIKRMNSLTLLSETFDTSLLPQIPQHKIDKPHDLIKLTIKFSEVISYRVYDDFPSQYIIQNDDNSLTVKMTVPNGDWLLQYLLSFGCDAEILSPDRLRIALRKKAEDITKLYNNF